MAVHEILKMGDPRLLRVAPPLPASAFGSPELKTLIDDMFETMKAANGAGLAAPQIGVDLQVVIFGYQSNVRYPDAFTNYFNRAQSSAFGSSSARRISVSEHATLGRIGTRRQSCGACHWPSLVLSVWLRSQGRALNRYGLAVSAPTGQICTVLPLK